MQLADAVSSFVTSPEQNESEYKRSVRILVEPSETLRHTQSGELVFVRKGPEAHRRALKLINIPQANNLLGTWSDEAKSNDQRSYRLITHRFEEEYMGVIIFGGVPPPARSNRKGGWNVAATYRGPTDCVNYWRAVPHIASSELGVIIIPSLDQPIVTPYVNYVPETMLDEITNEYVRPIVYRIGTAIHSYNPNNTMRTAGIQLTGKLVDGSTDGINRHGDYVNSAGTIRIDTSAGSL